MSKYTWVLVREDESGLKTYYEYDHGKLVQVPIRNVESSENNERTRLNVGDVVAVRTYHSRHNPNYTETLATVDAVGVDTSRIRINGGCRSICTTGTLRSTTLPDGTVNETAIYESAEGHTTYTRELPT